MLDIPLFTIRNLLIPVMSAQLLGSVLIYLTLVLLGEYDEMNIWSQSKRDFYQKKLAVRTEQETLESKNIEALIDHENRK